MATFILSMVVLIVASMLRAFYTIPMSRWLKWTVFGAGVILNYLSLVPAVKWLEPISIILLVVFILAEPPVATENKSKGL